MRCRPAISLVLMLGLQVPFVTARAHDRVENRRVAATSTYCVYEASLLREDSGDRGYARARVRSYRADCETAVNRDIEFLSQSLRVWFSSTVDGQQRLCVYTNFYYNQEPAWGFGLVLPFPPRPYCGPGWYELEGGGYLWADGAWRGGRVWSGRHLLN